VEREVNLTEAAMAAAITVSIAGVSYAALNQHAVVNKATQVADAASCRTIDGAIVAYVAQHGATPTKIAQLKPYVKGDITKYRIVNGVAAGPGC
jgi:hypothetical protein